MYSLCILEDNVVLRRSIEEYLTTTGKYQVTFSGGDGNSMLLWKHEIYPDFILLDIHLNDLSGIDIIKAIKVQFPEAHIIIITGDKSKESLIQAFEFGASAFLYKPFLVSDLDKVIDQVNNTGSFLEPDVLTKLLGLICQKNSPTSLFDKDDLTTREKELILLIKKGYTYKEMASELKLSFHTVNFHLKNIYAKTNVRSKSELIAKYFQTN
jgi:DNA-binding NarL/FixJ family response regulator